MKKYYWLTAGSVRYRDAEGNHRSRDLNTLLVTTSSTVTRKDLEHTQQAMQIRLFKELGLTEAELAGLTVYDVFISGISALGHMTPTVFNAGFADNSGEPTETKQ